MYKSPIDMIYDQRLKIDGEIYRAVLDVGIIVDKEELTKALAYDREQYEKGFEDGVQYARETYCSICAKRGI